MTRVTDRRMILLLLDHVLAGVAEAVCHLADLKGHAAKSRGNRRRRASIKRKRRARRRRRP